MPEIEDRLVGHLKAKGYSNEDARRIARGSLQKNGILKKGTDQLTPKGKTHNALGPKGRAKPRAKKRK
jgi:hypothetical protein